MLILGKTRCIISKKIIYTESRAARLPYVGSESINFINVSQDKLLEFSTRPYVLRNEWIDWVYKDQFSHAAFALKLNFLKSQDHAEVFLGSFDNFILSKVLNQNLVILEDFDGLFRFDMSLLDFDNLKNLLLQNKSRSTLILDDYLVIHDFESQSVTIAVSETNEIVKISTYEGQRLLDLKELIENVNIMLHDTQSSRRKPADQIEM